MTMFEGLGFPTPDGLPLWLSNTQTFVHEELNPAGSWPSGMTATIEFANGVVWPATVAGNLVAWRIEPAASTAAIIPDRTRWSAKLSVPSTTGGTATKYTWFGGSVVRSDLP